MARNIFQNSDNDCLEGLISEDGHPVKVEGITLVEYERTAPEMLACIEAHRDSINNTHSNHTPRLIKRKLLTAEHPPIASQRSTHKNRKKK